MRIGTTLAAALICSSTLLGFTCTADAAGPRGIGGEPPGFPADQLALHTVSIQLQGLDRSFLDDVNLIIRTVDGDEIKMLQRGQGTYFAPVTAEKLMLDIQDPATGNWTVEVDLPQDDVAVRMSVRLGKGGPEVTFLPDLSSGASAGASGGCLDCEPGDLIEPEDCGGDVNGGCNSVPPAFTDAQCGDWWCGTAYGSAAGTRDTDWYLVVITEPTELSGTLYSEFDGVVFIVGGIDACAPVVLGATGSSNLCNPGTASAIVDPGNYVVFVATASFSSPECGTDMNDYRLYIDCQPVSTDGACCYPDGSCQELGEDDCNAGGGSWNGIGSLCNQVFCPVAADNDLCEDAVGPLAVPSVTLGTTNGATIDSEFPFCGTGITSPGVWYWVVGTGNTMTASTCGGFYDYDTKISVYCGSCDEPLCLGGNDDNCSGGASGLLSTVSWCSQAGGEYAILVHGFGGATGDFELFLSDDGVPCQADVVCVTQGACCLPSGECAIVTAQGCDDAGGYYYGDDTECTGAPANDALITIEILTDNFASETTWELYDEHGTLVADGDPDNNATLYTWDIPVPSCGCYDFTIYDTFGDGICCGWGIGYYNVYYNGGLVASGGEYGYEESVYGVGGCTGCDGGVGACCVGATQDCFVTTEDCCEAAGGCFLGSGTNCGDGGFDVGPGGAFEDITGTGTLLALPDDGGQFVGLGFSFDFYGATYTDVAVTSNGYLTFSGDDLSDFSEDAIPNPQLPNNFIAPLWDDLDPGNAGSPATVHYGTYGVAPNRTFVAQYTDVPEFPDTGANTFQVVLFEGSNCVEFRYGSMTTTDWVAGIENADGTDGVDVSGLVAPGNSIRICPATGAECDFTPPDVSCYAMFPPDVDPPDGMDFGGGWGMYIGFVQVLFDATDDSGIASIEAVVDIGCDEVPVENEDWVILWCGRCDGRPNSALGDDECWAFWFVNYWLVRTDQSAWLRVTATDNCGNVGYCEYELCELFEELNGPTSK